MPRRGDTIVPHDTQQETSIRGIYIQNLTDLLHVCLLRGEFERARRAWAILVSFFTLYSGQHLTFRSDVANSTGGQDGTGVCSSLKPPAEATSVFPRHSPATLKRKAKEEKPSVGSSLYVFQLGRSK